MSFRSKMTRKQVSENVAASMHNPNTVSPVETSIPSQTSKDEAILLAPSKSRKTPSFGPFQPSKVSLSSHSDVSSQQLETKAPMQSPPSTSQVLASKSRHLMHHPSKLNISSKNVAALNASDRISFPSQPSKATKISNFFINSKQTRPAATTINSPLSKQVNPNTTTKGASHISQLSKTSTASITSDNLLPPQEKIVQTKQSGVRLDKFVTLSSPTTIGGQNNTSPQSKDDNPSMGRPEQSTELSGYSSEEMEELEIEARHENEEHENEADLSFSRGKKKVYRPGGKVQWTDDIQVDPDEVVQIEELRENEPPKLGIMEGTIVGKHVWCLPPRRRIIVHFNEYDQPVRKAGLVLVHFLSDLSKDGSHCPIGEISWKRVDKHYKSQLVNIVRDKFVLPDRAEINRMMLSHINIKWKHHRWELQRDYYRPNLSKEKLIEKMPPNIIKEQWIKLVSYWCSDRFKKLSGIGKKARASQDHVHTTGSKSFAQWKIEFVKKHKKEPSSLELWKRTHITKDGGYIKGTCTQEFMDIAETRVEERVSSSGKPREEVETEVFNELMYDDNNPNQRVVGFGLGVTKSQVFGLNGDLRKRRFDDMGGISSEVMGIKAYLISVEKKNEEVVFQLQNKTEALEKINESLQQRNDLLEKQNEELKVANEELKTKNDQVLAQLNHISSFMEKLEKNQIGV